MSAIRGCGGSRLGWVTNACLFFSSVGTNNLTALAAEANMTKIDVAKEVSSRFAGQNALFTRQRWMHVSTHLQVDCSPPREEDWSLHA